MRAILLFFLTILFLNTYAQKTLNVWQDVAEPVIQLAPNAERWIVPQSYRTVSLELNMLKTALQNAPMEGTSAAKNNPLNIAIPMPDGSMQAFAVYESPVMMPGLMAKYPMMKTFAGKAIGKKYTKIRLDYTQRGFHAIIQSPEGEVYIDPYANNETKHYISYYTRDLTDSQNTGNFKCGVSHKGEDDIQIVEDEQVVLSSSSTGFQTQAAEIELRTYRLAMAGTAEYTSFHGGTVALGLAAIVEVVNRLNMVFETDAAVRLVLVENNDLIVFLDSATDGYDNGSVDAMLGQNQPILNGFIGQGNYDIGHVVARGGLQGVAFLGATCGGNKGGGVSRLQSPVGDPFVIDIIGHEVGHQFNANHSMSSCQNVNSGTAYEPGSGSTIMSYSGICPQPNNVQLYSDAYYFTHSLQEILLFTRSGGGNSCPIKTPTGNSEPTAEIPIEDGFYIPISTPFELTGTGTDEDGDDLTYCWEQYDLGPMNEPGSPTLNSPLFRSFPPVSSTTRVFPKMSTIVNNSNDVFEDLPDYSRDLTFRMTVRDNNPAGGGAVWDKVAFHSTDEAGPFLVTYPNNSVQLSVGDYVAVTWDVANTTNNLVNCQKVNIKLSTDGGYNYPISLAENIPNSGSFSVIVPDQITSSARVRVEAADNIFFDISNSNFEIIPATQPGYALNVTPYTQRVCAPDPAIINLEMLSLVGYDSLVSFTVNGLPNGAVPVFSANPALPSEGSVLSIETENVTEQGIFEIEIIAIAPNADTSYRTTFFEIVISDFSTFAPIAPLNGSDGVTELPTFTWSGSTFADSYSIEIATSPVFGDSTIAAVSGILDTFYVPSVVLEKTTLYFWRISATNVCGTKGYGQIQAFHTETFSCLSYQSVNVPMNISNVGTPTIESTLAVPIEGIINDLNVTQVKGNHDRVNHIDVSLISPDSTEVVLFANDCITTSTFNAGFDDAAPTGILCPPIGVYQPQGSLSDFNGQNSQGIWTLRISVNNTDGAGGVLQDWSLTMCSNVSQNAPYLVTNDTLFVIPGDYRLITDEFLLSEDDDNSASELTYTLVSIPQNGAIFFLNNQLEVGQTFRQSSLNAGNVRYWHDGGPSEFDDFTFAVTDGEGGWFGTPRFIIAMDPDMNPTSNNEIEEISNEVFLFPNPAMDVLNARFKNPIVGKLNLIITNVQGQVVRNTIFGNIHQQFKMNTADLMNGIYFVQMLTGEKVFTKKVVIQR